MPNAHAHELANTTTATGALLDPERWPSKSSRRLSEARG
jgi:hypothetical protein